MQDAVIKIKRKRSFTNLPNSTLRDNRLSLKTRAILAIMLSLPDDWDYSVSGLAVICGVGRDSIRASLVQLEEAGYLTRRQLHNEAGKFAGNEYIITDEPSDRLPEEECAPLPGKPSSAEPSSAEPLTENPPQQNKDYTNTPYSPPEQPDGLLGDGEDAHSVAHGPADNPPNRQPDWKLFDRFWAAYPRRKDKARAKRAWKKLNPDIGLFHVMAAALERDKQSWDWRKENGAYIPYPSTWLNGRRWEDEDGDPPPAPLPESAPLRPEGGRWL